jgi:predicted DNA-binding transcriptional regulator AlpA
VSAQFLDVPQLADRWGVSVKVVYGLRYRNDCPPAVRIGRELRWRLEDVVAWEDARREAVGSPRR